MLKRKKHRLKPLSLYPLKPEEVLSAVMKIKYRSLKNKKRGKRARDVNAP
jgi:hypothetical protein